MNRRRLLRLAGLSGMALGARSIPTDGATLNLPMVSVPDPTLTFDERLIEIGIDRILPRWESTGLLEGIPNEYNRRTLAQVMENQHNFNEYETRLESSGVLTWHEGSINGVNDSHVTEMRFNHFGSTMDPAVRRISIPLVRRALQRIFDEGWLPLQPLTTPNALLYYWRRRMRQAPVLTDSGDYLSNAELIRQGRPYIYVKESEDVCCSIVSYEEWTPPTDVERQSPLVLDQEANRVHPSPSPSPIPSWIWLSAPF